MECCEPANYWLGVFSLCVSTAAAYRNGATERPLINISKRYSSACGHCVRHGLPRVLDSRPGTVAAIRGTYDIYYM